MSLPRPWDTNLQNASPILQSTANGAQLSGYGMGRSAPVLPPRPMQSLSNSPTYNSYVPYSGGFGGYGSGFNSYGSYGSGFNSYGSYGLPYRNSLYSSYGGYNSAPYAYGMTGRFDDAERRFIQYAEDSSRHTFASVESIVRAFNSIAMMLDNTFFAMTSSFRAVLSVAENFGRLRTTFGHIWYSISIFRLFSWMYRKMMQLMGFRVHQPVTSAAWNQAAGGKLPDGGSTPGSSWPTLAFLGVLVSAPYIISKFLPKYEDKGDPASWRSPGIKAKAAFDFVATSPSEMSMTTNDEIVLAPTYIQEEMSLKNTGWAFAVCNGHSGLVPLNYLVLNKSKTNIQPVLKHTSGPKTHTKRVSFGENQIFENVDLEDYVKIKGQGGCEGEAKKENERTDSLTVNSDSSNKSESVHSVKE